MTANARHLRVERFAEIGMVIQRDASTMIERWARRTVEEQPKARRVHHDVLLDHLPSFLWQLGASLSTAGDPDNCPHCHSAVQHGEQRWEVGWSLAEVFRDYRILRLIILEHIDGCLDRSLRLREIQAVGLAIDEAIEASVERYVSSRDEQYQQMQTLLQEADRRKNEFLATLAHELRNPLAPLRNSLEVVRLSGDSAAAMGQVRELMDRQVQQLTRLVEDLLDVARIAQGKLVLRQEPSDLRQSLQEAVQMNAPLRESRQHHLALELPALPLMVKCDPSRLVQVVVNLLNNAAKYTPERGRIELTAHREGDWAVVRVKDNGVGIPTDKLAHIFNLFTQIDLGPERTQGGLGIGLTLVRRLVELHEGSIEVSSDGAGQGSEFVVRLPTVAQPPEAVPLARDHQAAPCRHILIVEDNQDARESLALLLRMVGHRVDVAADGQQGMTKARTLRPEVALIDIGLPDTEGYEVARHVRADLGSAVLLVALTGFSQPEDRQRALEAGFNAHLAKPIELEALQALLAEYPAWASATKRVRD